MPLNMLKLCTHEAKKTINRLGLHYTKIDACSNDCMLYLGEHANRDFCKKCKTSRWKAKEKKVQLIVLLVTKEKRFLQRF